MCVAAGALMLGFAAAESVSANGVAHAAGTTTSVACPQSRTTSISTVTGTETLTVSTTTVVETTTVISTTTTATTTETDTTTTGTVTSTTTTPVTTTVPVTTTAPVTATVPTTVYVPTTTTKTRTTTKQTPLPWKLPVGAKAVSNGTTYTVVAESNNTGAVRAKPNSHAHVITHLRYFTPDSEALQTYMIVAQRTVHHKLWLLVDLPMRPNGTMGWVPRSYLGAYIETHKQIVVNRADRALLLCQSGKPVFRAPVGVGRPSLPTPPGHFWVTESFPSSDPFYGPWALGTSDYASPADESEFPDGGLVGIHGSNAPQLIPGDPSHGCMRLHNQDILTLKSQVGIGVGLWVQ